MSRFEIKMPKLGESITEGTIISWTVKVGDMVNEDDVLFEVSTAKVSAEIPSPVAGKVVEILFNEGDTIPIGTIVAIVDMDGDASENTPEKKEEVKSPEIKKDTPVSQPETKPEKPEPVVSTAAPVESAKKESSNDERWYSPAVLRLAQEAKIAQAELDSILGTGYLGRVSKTDIEHYIEQKKTGVVPPAAVAATVTEPKPAPVSEPVAASAPKSVSTAVTASGDEVVPMDFVRRLIADRMVMSKKTSPHVTTVVEVDVTSLVRWRDRIKDEFFRKEGVKLTFMPAIAEATAKALTDFPQVNASVDGYNMIIKKNINIGIAVAQDNGNLIVPVIHNANKLNINGLASEIDNLAVKARKNKLTAADIEGGTFTITNFGTFKNIIGMPIINQPEVAILGVGYIEKKPAVIETPEGDVIAIRHKMYLSLSYDHRIIDGSLGGAFLKRIADYLEDWKMDVV